MDKISKTLVLAGYLLTLIWFNPVIADNATILAASFRNMGNGLWSVKVTLKHGDTGWDHYADNWRVVDGEGNIIGDRVLHHPHVNEQPFTRELSGVKIPEGITTVYIEAHDKMHGWGLNRLVVDLKKVVNGRLTVKVE